MREGDLAVIGGNIVGCVELLDLCRRYPALATKGAGLRVSLSAAALKTDLEDLLREVAQEKGA